MRICDEERKKWAKHLQCDSEVQSLADRSLRIEELRNLEEGMPRLKKDIFERAVVSYKTAAGVGCDGFHLKVPPAADSDQRHEGARSIALLPILFVGVKGCVRLICGEAHEDIVLAGMLGRESVQCGWRCSWWTDLILSRVKWMNQGAITLVLDLAKTFERVSLPVVWAWTTHSNVPRKFLIVLCVYFEHQRRVQFEAFLAEQLQTITHSLFFFLSDMITDASDVAPYQQRRHLTSARTSVTELLEKNAQKQFSKTFP